MNTFSVGPYVHRLHITDIFGGFATGINQLGQYMRIPISTLPSKSIPPAVGETWVISRAVTGVWTFCAILTNPGIKATALTSGKKGQILICTDTNKWELLNPGTNGQVLTIVTGLPQWATDTP